MIFFKNIKIEKRKSYENGIIVGLLLAILLVWLVFITMDQVYANEIEYNNPIGSDISLGNSYNFFSDSSTRDKFCLENGFPQVKSYTESSINFTSLNKWTTSWVIENSMWGSDKIDQIICENPNGCTNENSSNYDNTATIDDGSCLACNTNDFVGCSEIGCDTLSNTQWLDGQCISNELGCTDELATNYNPTANTGDPINYCTYCSINTPQYCDNEDDCNLVNGTWDNVNSYCESLTPPQTLEGEITIKPPNDPSYSVSATIPTGYTSLVRQSCVSYNSSNICDSWRWDLDDDFWTSLMKIFTKIGTILLFIFFIVILLFMFWRWIKYFIIGRLFR